MDFGMIKVITHHAPQFLKAAYSHPQVDLINHEGFVEAGEFYVRYDGEFLTFRMTPERVPIPRGRYKTLNSAIHATGA
jgi:hypothetical protein